MSQPLDPPKAPFCSGVGKYCKYKLVSHDADLTVYQCEQCLTLVNVRPEGENLQPYSIVMTDDYIAMALGQCEGCEEYQESRPTCKFVIDYFKGKFPPGAPPAWFRTMDGRPVCTKRKADINHIPKLGVLQDPEVVPQPPEPAEPPIYVLYHDGSDSLVVVEGDAERDKCLNVGCDLWGPEAIQKELLKTIFKYEEG